MAASSSGRNHSAPVVVMCSVSRNSNTSPSVNGQRVTAQNQSDGSTKVAPKRLAAALSTLIEFHVTKGEI